MALPPPAPFPLQLQAGQGFTSICSSPALLQATSSHTRVSRVLKKASQRSSTAGKKGTSPICFCFCLSHLDRAVHNQHQSRFSEVLFPHGKERAPHPKSGHPPLVHHCPLEGDVPNQPNVTAFQHKARTLKGDVPSQPNTTAFQHKPQMLDHSNISPAQPPPSVRTGLGLGPGTALPAPQLRPGPAAAGHGSRGSIPL